MGKTTAAGLIACALLAAAVPIASGRAQDTGDIAAYVALQFTPPAGFAPIVTRTMLGDARPGWDFTPRYGRVDLFEDAANNFALSFVHGSNRGSFGVTAGYWNPDCDNCDGHFVAGLGGDVRLFVSPVGTGPGAMALNVGLNGEIGFGKPQDATVWSATAGLPVTLVASGSGIRLAPFITPAVGYGHISVDGGSESGVRAMLGGGIGIIGANGFGVTVGFQKVFIDEGTTTLGVNASLRL
jgi:hypothetical protein